ncbi:MAG: outer membrane lipoprotein-sorting protein [Myxococcota bacterium]
MKTWTAVLILSTAATASAESGDSILGRVDQTLSGFKDQTFDAVMRVIEAGGESRERRFRTQQKGGDKRLVRFTAPADVKGMAVLVDGRDNMYVYLPAYARVRRIAGHTREQGFLGSDFSYEDMGDVKWGEKYAATLKGETAEAWTLELKPRDPEETEYARLVMTAGKKTLHPEKLEYFDAGGRKAKTQTQENYAFVESVKTWIPRLITMTDHRRGNHRTEMDIAVVGINTGIADEQFTQRSLERGP